MPKREAGPLPNTWCKNQPQVDHRAKCTHGTHAGGKTVESGQRRPGADFWASKATRGKRQVGRHQIQAVSREGGRPVNRDSLVHVQAYSLGHHVQSDTKHHMTQFKQRAKVSNGRFSREDAAADNRQTRSHSALLTSRETQIQSAQRAPATRGQGLCPRKSPCPESPWLPVEHQGA